MWRIGILPPLWQDKLWAQKRVSRTEMNQTESPASAPSSRSFLTVRRMLLYSIPMMCVLLAAGAVFIPKFDSSRQSANEVFAVAKLRQINTLQEKYSADHPSIGFSCALKPLWVLNPDGPNDYDRLGFLRSGTTSGYKFSLSGCSAGPDGRVVHYQATAVPVWLGASGYRAFCTDDSGRLWYDHGGSAIACLESLRPLP